MATREDFMRMSPDGVVRKSGEIPFGHMVFGLETPSRFALGETVQAVVVRKVWNGKDYVNGDSAEGIDVWNVVVTDLHNLKTTVSGIVEGLKVFEATMQTWTANVKAQVESIDKNLGAPLEERINKLLQMLLTSENQIIEGNVNKTIDWTAPVAAQIEAKIEEIITNRIAMVFAGRIQDPGHTSQLANEPILENASDDPGRASPPKGIDHHQV